MKLNYIKYQIFPVFFLLLFGFSLLAPPVSLAFKTSEVNSDTNRSSMEVDGAQPFTLPTVTLDGEPIPEKIILAALKFGAVQNTIFHGENNFDAYVQQKWESTVNTLIPRFLLAREGQRTGIIIDDNRFNTFIGERIEQFGGKEALEGMFETVKLPFEDYVALSRQAFGARLYVEKLFENIIVSEEDALTYYQENKERYGKLGTRTVSFTRYIFRKDPVDIESIGDLRAAASDIGTNNTLTKVSDRLRKKYPVDVTNMYDIVITEKVTGPLWIGAQELAKGQCGYFPFTTRPGVKEHYLILVNQITPENIRPYEEIKSRIVNRLVKDRQKAILEQKVAEL
ncbi:MAG: peptidyl-prolyl cis-trans isomerase, partial [bacterium]|nr:peptidyl-prolyl cis-trans isomerase [bacterium]